jgi:GAF domain-containing protein
MTDFDRLLADLRRVADAHGPALVRAAHGDLLQSIADTARHLLSAAACSLALVDGEDLVYEVASGEGADNVLGQRLPLGRGVGGWVAVSGQPMAVSDVQRDPRFAGDFAASTAYVPRSLLAVPLQTPRQVVGVLTVLDGSPDATMDLLTRFADQAAAAIETAQSFARLGELLLSSAASATDGDLADALRRTALLPAVPGSDADLELARQVLAVAAGTERDKALAADLLRVLVERSAAAS